jgi:hypothetical protein
LAAGFDDFIRKPYKDTEIFDALSKHLDVRFAYEEETPLAGESVPPLEASALAELPPTLLNELEQALVLLDVRAVDQAIEAVRAQYPAVADALVAEAKDLQYGRILQVIEAISSGEAGTKDQTQVKT